jgi:hypothetical protein
MAGTPLLKAAQGVFDPAMLVEADGFPLRASGGATHHGGHGFAAGAECIDGWIVAAQLKENPSIATGPAQGAWGVIDRYRLATINRAD